MASVLFSHAFLTVTSPSTAIHTLVSGSVSLFLALSLSRFLSLSLSVSVTVTVSPPSLFHLLFRVRPTLPSSFMLLPVGFLLFSHPSPSSAGLILRTLFQAIPSHPILGSLIDILSYKRILTVPFVESGLSCPTAPTRHTACSLNLFVIPYQPNESPSCRPRKILR